MENKSTILATNKLVAQIEKGFKQKQTTQAVLLDINGAFDNAWHTTVINGLISRNCPDYLLFIVQSFLSKRKATIIQNNSRHTVGLPTVWV